MVYYTKIIPKKGKLNQNLYFSSISLEVCRLIAKKESSLSKKNDTNYKVI